jgi:peptide deformylase
VLKILKDNHPILRQVASPVEEITDELKQLAVKMLATMRLEGGIGLAAPQVGESISLIVFDCVNQTYSANDSGIMFNPKILGSSKEVATDIEGCLSFPGETCKVTRPLRIKVEYLDLANRTVVRSFSGLGARVILHEMDHLLGITMNDREIE